MTGAREEGRFARQTRFAPLGERGQAALERSSVLVVGCGALGGVLAQWLCRAGVGRVVLVDRDVVEETNLPRQVLFTAAHARAGAAKAAATAESLAAVGGPTVLEPHARHLDAALLRELGARVDLVLDGTDNMATRYLLNDHAVATGTPWIYGGVVSGAGLVLPVVPEGEGRAGSACLRCLFRDPPPPGTLPTCDTAGVIGPAVGAVASMQAGLALRLLVAPQDFEPALVELDAWGGGVRRIRVPRDPGCPCCAARAFPFLEGAEVTDAVSLCGRNTVQVLPAAGSARPDTAALADQLGAAGIAVQRVGPLARFRADGCRFTLFPDGRALVEGTDDTDRARALVARWIGA